MTILPELVVAKATASTINDLLEMAGVGSD